MYIDQNVSDEVINKELSKVSQWLAANKLSLNVAKTKFMVFHMHQKAVTYPDLYLNGNKILSMSPRYSISDFIK